VGGVFRALKVAILLVLLVFVYTTGVLSVTILNGFKRLSRTGWVEVAVKACA